MAHLEEDPSDADNFEQQLRRTAHDLRHCLYVIQHGLVLLQAFREDEPKFDSTLDLLKQEHAQACKQIEDLIVLARSRLAE